MYALVFGGLIAAFLVWIGLGFAARKVNLKGKIVLVTGLSTARYLAQQQVKVIACCFTTDGVKNLQNSDNIEVHQLDITNDQQVRDLFVLIRNKYPRGLHGLVNNAGIFDGSLFEFTNISYYEKIMQVNYMGTLMVLKSFLPLLKLTKGTIINMSSGAGRLPCPGLSAYCASKFAIEGLSETLRQEFQTFGIKVVIMEPVAIKTPMPTIFMSQIDKFWNESPQIRDEYGEIFWSKFKDSCSKIYAQGIDPIVVAKSIDQTLRLESPPLRVRVGFPLNIAGGFLSALPDWLTDFILLSNFGLATPKEVSKNQ